MPKRSRRKLLLWSAPVTALFLAAAAGWLGWLGTPIKRAALSVAAPIHAAGINASSALRRLTTGRDGSDDEMTAEVERLKLENSKLLALLTENQELKASLGYSERGNLNAVTAKVVYETGDDTRREIVIDRGSADGIEVGQPAIVGDGIIVGKVGSVGPTSSSVRLLSDSRSRLAVTVQNAQDTLGVLEGDRGLSMSIELIPQTEYLIPGDTVITSGLEPGIGRGLAVGTVDKVEASTQDPFQSASVQPYRAALHPTIVQVIVESVTETGS
jgi:rod shape-determining protein MreC